MTKRVLIIGGGIAGPVTAMALRKAGLDPVVYEAYGRGAEGVGAFLTLAVNGIEALNVLELAHLVAGLGMDSPKMQMLSGRAARSGAARSSRGDATRPERRGSGKVLATMDFGGLTSFGMPSKTIKRADLYTALRDEAVRRGVPVQYGKRLVDAVPSGDGVRAVFADGTTAEGDLLIGADGLRSRVRSIIDPRAPKPRYVGLLNAGGFAKGVSVPGEPGTAYFMFGRRCFFGYLIHPEGDVWWFANPGRRVEPTPAQLAAIPADQWRAELNELFKDDAGPALDIIAATDEIFAGWPTYDMPTVPKWRNDRMVLIGDAAHATSPSSGQGASISIEDAIVLAKSLRDNPRTDRALAAFEAARRERVERIVAQGKRSGDQKAPGPVGRWIRDLMLPVIMPRVAKSKALRLTYEYRITWN